MKQLSEKKKERERKRDKKSLYAREARLPKTIYISLTIKVRKSSEQTGKNVATLVAKTKRSLLFILLFQGFPSLADRGLCPRHPKS